jgi:hypothetical protein
MSQLGQYNPIYDKHKRPRALLGDLSRCKVKRLYSELFILIHKYERRKYLKSCLSRMTHTPGDRG